MGKTTTCASCAGELGAGHTTCRWCGVPVAAGRAGIGGMTLALMIGRGAAAIAIVAALLFGTSTEPAAGPGVEEQLGQMYEESGAPSDAEAVRRFLRNKPPAEQDCLIEEYQEQFTDEQLGRIVNRGPVEAAEVAEMEAAGEIC